MSLDRIIVRGFGLELLKTETYRTGINLAQSQNAVPKTENQYKIPKAFEKDSPIRISFLGNGVFSDLQFGQVTVDGVLLDPFIPIDTVLYTVTQTKNIVTTSIQGRNGTIKEYISDGDAQINIKGALCGTNGVYPVDQVNNLLQYLNANVSLPIYSGGLQRLGIFEVVVMGFNFPQTSGAYSTQLFEITCVSDIPIILKAQ